MRGHRPRWPARGLTLSWAPFFLASAAIAVVYLLAMLARVGSSGLMGLYPFVSSDSYDWLLEGYALSRALEGAPMLELPVLRNPGFVSVTLVDAWLGSSGLVVLGAITLSVFLLMAAMICIAREYEWHKWETAALLTFVVACPVAFFRPYVLADQLATSLMVAAIAGLVMYQKRRHTAWLALATATAIIGGITQSYAIVPFLVITGWWFLCTVLAGRPGWSLGGSSVLAAGVTLSTLVLWQRVVPHDTVPVQLGLLRLDDDMLSFYVHAWGFAFSPIFLVLVLVVARGRRRIARDPIAGGCWWAVAALGIASLLYQWEDFRFTMPVAALIAVAVLVTAAGPGGVTRTKSTSFSYASLAALSAFSGAVLSVESFWVPDVSTVSVDPRNSALGQLFNTPEGDKIGLHAACVDERPVCSEWQLPTGLTPYREAVLSHFLTVAEQ
jgi:hypothetical protein